MGMEYDGVGGKFSEGYESQPHAGSSLFSNKECWARSFIRGSEAGSQRESRTGQYPDLRIITAVSVHSVPLRKCITTPDRITDTKSKQRHHPFHYLVSHSLEKP